MAVVASLTGDGRQSARLGTLLVRCCFVALYVGVLAWFGMVDVYHTHYFRAGPVYLGYNLARILFLSYLAWCQFYVGRLLLRFWERRGAHLGLSVLDEYLLCFFAGGACLAGLAFVLGFLQLYRYNLFAAGSIGLVALSSGEWVRMLPVWWSALARPVLHDNKPDRRYLYWLALACVTILAVALLALKGLYPGGRGDYYTHYFPYFRHVVQSHGLWPNDVWYHFYVSKGATITFSSILLTDLQAPETVTFLYFLLGSLCVYSLLRRWVNNRAVPCLGMAACMAALMVSGESWGHFQKHHEMTASLLMSVIWAAATCGDCGGAAGKAWLTFLALFAGHCVLFAPTIAPVVLATLGMVAAFALLRGARGVAIATAGGMICAGLVLSGTLAINYACTGLMEVSPMRPFWKYANQERFSRWTSPYLMTLLLEGSAPHMGDITVSKPPPGWNRAQFLRYAARTESIIWFFPDINSGVPYSVLLVLAIIAIRRWQGQQFLAGSWRLVVPVLGAVVVALLLSQLVTQPVSVFRYYSFMVYLMVLLGLGLWTLVPRMLPNRPAPLFTSYCVPVILLCLLTYRCLADVSKEMGDAIQFATGKQSLADGYRNQGVTSDIPILIRLAIGTKPRVYTLNMMYTSMAPECELESFVSFSLGKKWHEILFESPERARAALEEQGLNYFLICVDRSEDIYDVLQHAPLFQPEAVRSYFHVCWRRGNAYLLTWDTAPDTTPVPKEFFRFYKPAKYGTVHKRLISGNITDHLRGPVGTNRLTALTKR